MKKSYAFKFLFIAFIGIHIPLIGILFFVLYGNKTISADSILIFSLIMTLFATGFTLLIINQLIRPIVVASKALNEYRISRKVPVLPSQYEDEAGLLMRNIQDSIEESESFINEKQDLIYMISHDLRNFAGNPQGLAKLIIEENPSDSVKNMAELICESTDLQFRYIENFIKLLKQQDEIAKSSSIAKTILIAPILPAVMEQVAQLLARKNIKLVSDISIEEAVLRIDVELLIQVLVNLISNAIKFSYSGSEISLRIFKDDKKIVFTVLDNGIGFDQSQIEEMFKKFTTMGKLGTANETSTGIGLYLCKKIINKNGGKLNAISLGINRGAIFTIVFEKEAIFNATSF
ncbi:HAMP domain-containing sensor histidine kinase [Flavobacterium branchiarum]|uniref:histidine kinase n=1 Tax=Flavobacterium branchiarum TaxID=1114870 RepID=A0ABV5FHJ6_9FLAO|nr:HAMP domain-containing sensor histidine kinase [Flavobacterium branchiarum]MDN3673924.1 HAMP domain-containing sensor histidine kinase [Flavobacterium branchiarum]